MIAREGTNKTHTIYEKQQALELVQGVNKSQGLYSVLRLAMLCLSLLGLALL